MSDNEPAIRINIIWVLLILLLIGGGIVFVLKQRDTEQPEAAPETVKDPESYFQLGWCYYTGEGAEKDLKKAVELFTKAADLGHANAQFELGMCYYNGEGTPQNLSKAVELFTNAAEQEHADAQFILGGCYNEGKGVRKNTREAVEWWKKSAEQGYTDAQFELGMFYYNGDRKKAVVWFTEAAEQGHRDAQYKLGECYYNGKGVKKDLEKALEWFTMAAELGHKEALEAKENTERELANKKTHNPPARKTISSSELFSQGLHYYEQGNLKKAVDLFTQAAEQGHRDAQYKLGECYDNGKGVQKNPEKAAAWYMKAANRGYYYGDSYYKRDREQGHADAQYRLGLFYEYGMGVSKNESKALYWYTRAKLQGHKRAEQKLEGNERSRGFNNRYRRGYRKDRSPFSFKRQVDLP